MAIEQIIPAQEDPLAKKSKNSTATQLELEFDKKKEPQPQAEKQVFMTAEEYAADKESKKDLPYGYR